MSKKSFSERHDVWPPLPLLLTVEEAAKYANIGRTMFYALIKSGVISSVKVGRLRRVRFDDLQNWVAGL